MQANAINFAEFAFNALFSCADERIHLGRSDGNIEAKHPQRTYLLLSRISRKGLIGSGINHIYFDRWARLIGNLPDINANREPS